MFWSFLLFSSMGAGLACGLIALTYPIKSFWRIGLIVGMLINAANVAIVLAMMMGLVAL